MYITDLLMRLIYAWILLCFLRQHKNFVWLFELMFLLVECVRFDWFVQEECIVSNGEVGMFYFVGSCNSQDDFHHRGHITRSFFSVALVCQVITCTFDASRFEMAILLVVLWHWAISLLCLGGSNFILQCRIYSTLNMPLLFGASLTLSFDTVIGFQPTKSCRVFSFRDRTW
jgi:hypothetical protein